MANDAQEGFQELLDHLGDRTKEFPLPDSATRVVEWHRTVMEAELAFHYAEDYRRGKERMSVLLREQIERGHHVSATDYLSAKARISVITEALDEIFDRFDAVLTPATFGAAPRGLESTGDPRLCTLWTFCGMPAITLPLLQSEEGMPIGVQLVGRPGDDARLLRTARWLVKTLEAPVD